MKKRLSEKEFWAVIKGLEIGQQTIDIAYGVLVEGKSQAAFVESLGLSKGAVSQAVNRVWVTFKEQDLPEGFERVTAVLPQYQAYIVRQWAEKAQKQQDKS